MAPRHFGYAAVHRNSSCLTLAEIELEETENYKKQGTVIRSKEKIILNEEKSTKYFFLQEKQKQKKKQITLLENEQGKSITKTSDILKECTNYYQKLYTKPKTCEIAQKKLLKTITHKTTNKKDEKLTKKEEINEIREAIQSMENGTSPGVDDIPIEFYKEFLETIIPDFQKIYNETLFINKKTPKTWNQAKIMLIPKKGNIQLLKYWRPISRSCVDYKILTKY